MEQPTYLFVLEEYHIFLGVTFYPGSHLSNNTAQCSFLLTVMPKATETIYSNFGTFFEGRVSV